MSAQTLSQLLTDVRTYPLVTADSRRVVPGCIFVAVPGTRHDGNDFAARAVQDGAAVVVGEQALPLAVPYVTVSDARAALAQLSAAFHGQPSRRLLTIGVTGTCGKTTTTNLIEAILTAAGRRVGLIGTVEYRYPGTVLPASHTTPGAEELQALLAQMVAAGCDAVVMEVSSHALKLKRSLGMLFDVVVFTNLSVEHLDLHPDMEDYFATKTELFIDYADAARAAGKQPRAVINVGDAHGARLAQLLRDRAVATPLIEFAAAGAPLDARALEFRADGIRGQVGDVSVQSTLVGHFNGENLLAAIGVGRALDLDAATIGRGLARVSRVPGRLDPLGDEGSGIKVFIDYAHKPGGLEVVLKTLDQLKGNGRLISVFGCGGDRDRTKRPIMGRIAHELSDLVWVTSDSPRTESPTQIVDEILAGIPDRTQVHVELDRRTAIHAAIASARRGDLVVIAGKGHETYQIIAAPAEASGTRKIHFDDREVADEALRARAAIAHRAL